jgi:hypothetical protein
MLTEWQYQRWTRALELLKDGRIIVFRRVSLPERKGVAKMVGGRIRYRLFELQNGWWILIYENKNVTEDDIALMIEVGWSTELGRPKDFFRRHRDG